MNIKHVPTYLKIWRIVNLIVCSIINPSQVITSDRCYYRTSGATAAAISVSTGAAPVSSSCSSPSCWFLSSNNLVHQTGGSSGRCPLWSGGYTSLKKYHTVEHPQVSYHRRETPKHRIRLTMSNNNPANLILRHCTMQHQTKRHKHPRQIRRREHQQAQEAQPCLRIAPTPYIHQRARERRA